MQMDAEFVAEDRPRGAGHEGDDLLPAAAPEGRDGPAPEGALLESYCAQTSEVIAAHGSPALRDLLTRHRLTRPYSRFQFHAPGRPEPTPQAVATLERSLLVESSMEREWQAAALRCVTPPLGPSVTKDLGQLAVEELQTRLPRVRIAGASWQRRLAAAAASAMPDLRRLSAPESTPFSAVALRYEACRIVWAQFLIESFFTLTPTVLEAPDNGAYVAHQLERECRLNLERVGVEHQQFLLSRSGGVVLAPLLLRLDEGPGASLERLARAMDGDSLQAAPIDWIDDLEAGPDDDHDAPKLPEDEAEEQRDKEQHDCENEVLLRQVRRDVATQREVLVRLEQAVHREIESSDPEQAALLALAHWDPEIQAQRLAEELPAAYQGTGLNAIRIAMSRAKTWRRHLLAAHGLIRAREDRDPALLGARHVVPECVGRVCEPARVPAARLRQREQRLAEALADLPADETEAWESADSLLRDIWDLRQVLRDVLSPKSCSLLFEKGLSTKPKRIPSNLWRPDQRARTAVQDWAAWAARPGRVIIAPRSVEYVWRIDDEFVAGFPKEHRDRMRKLLDDPTPGQWYYFLNGGTRV